MSRSNGPMVPPGGVSPRPARQLNQAPPGMPGAQPPPPPQQHPAPSEQLSQVAYRQPAPRAQGYAPQFDAYVPPQPSPPPAPQPAYVPPQQTYAQPHGYEQPTFPPQQPVYAQPPQASRAPAPVYDQWSPPPAAPDPHGYDMGGFAAPHHDTRYHPEAAHDAGGYQPQHQHASLAPSLQAPTDWNQHAQYAGPAHEPTLDAGGYHPDQQQAYAQAQPAEATGDYAEDDEDYEVESGGSGRFLRIAAALVGAIVVGGGLAFAYTQLMTSDPGKPPIIKNAGGPNKVKPADPGGKKFANTDSKLMGRLNDGASSETDASGVKKVPTVKVGADGSIIPPTETPAEAPAAAPAPPAADDTGFPTTGATLASTVAPEPPAVQAEAPVTVSPPKLPEAPVKIAEAAAEEVKSAVSPTTTSSIAAAAAATKPAAAPAVKKIATAAPAVAAATAPTAPKKPATAAVTSPASTGAGYVAVLASVPVSTTSRIAALKQFADMQQKYTSVLQNKAPEVKEANLGDKGTYHRLLVGPPGSREGAQALCGSLKQAGYAESCWVTAY